MEEKGKNTEFECEELYKALIQTSPDAITITDLNGRIVEASQQTVLIHGFKDKKELIGLNALDMIAPADRRRAIENTGKTLKDGSVKNIEYRLLRKDGTTFYCDLSASVVLDREGNPKGFIGVVRDITKRKLAEAALKESEGRYRQLVELSPDGIAVHSEGKIVFTNTAAAKALGAKSPGDLVGKNLWEIVHLDSHVLAKERIRRMMRGERVPIAEEKFVRFDGAVVKVEVSAAPLIYNGKKAIQVVVRDVTERKRIEESVREGERFLSNVFTSIQDGVSVLDKDMRIIRVNPTMERWYSHAKPLVGKKCYDAYHSRSKRCEICPTYQTLKSGKSAHEVVPKRGSKGRIVGWLDLYSFPLLDSKTGQMKGVIEYVRDITKRRIAVEELRGVRDHLQTILDGIEESIVVIDRHYRIVSHNRAFVKSLRGWKKSVIGESCFKIIHGFTRPCNKCVIRNMFRTGKPSYDVHYHLEKGGKVYHEVKAYPLRDVSGSIGQCIYVFRDVTEREGMYDRIKETNIKLEELNKMKSDFISIASHELRTPLAIIKGYVDLMDDGLLGSVNSKQKEKLEAIGSNISHLNRLIEDILDLSRIEAGELKLRMKLTNLVSLTKGVVEDFKPIVARKGVLLRVKQVGRRIEAKIDVDKVKQVLINLLDNAVKFTPSGGCVTVRLSKAGKYVVLSVADRGVGIAKKNIDKIFTMFYQVDSTPKRMYGGVGLGLSICKKIVELHGGAITVKSKVN
ncbi:MAG: PAS domain S-box protein, partial [Candidatus Altiarchaeota archaeon]